MILLRWSFFFYSYFHDVCTISRVYESYILCSDTRIIFSSLWKWQLPFNHSLSPGQQQRSLSGYSALYRNYGDTAPSGGSEQVLFFRLMNLSGKYQLDPSDEASFYWSSVIPLTRAPSMRKQRHLAEVKQILLRLMNLSNKYQLGPWKAEIDRFIEI